MKKTLTALAVLSAFAAAPAFANDMNGGADHMIKMMDTNGDGMVSRDEHAAFAEKKFDEADTNHDGQLSKDEIVAFHKKQQAMMGKKGNSDMSNKHVHTTPNDSDVNPHPTKDRTDQDM